MLHLMRVAVGCPDVLTLQQRIDANAEQDVAVVTTRYRPRRAEELIGGSLYWNIGHHLVARQTIRGFDTTEDGGRALIFLDRQLVEVVPKACRAHQGWRYLTAENAPADLAEGEAGQGALPPALRQKLAEIGLL